VHRQAHGFDPCDKLVCHTEWAEPTGAREPLLRGPRLGRRVGMSGGDIHNLLLMYTQDGMECRLAQERQMGKGAERPIPHEDIARAQGCMDCSNLGPGVGVPGGGEDLAQEARPRMKQGAQVGDRTPTPRALPRVANSALLCLSASVTVPPILDLLSVRCCYPTIIPECPVTQFL